MIGTAGAATAAGELNLYNWGNYTNPELLEKFEQQHGIKVTVTGYDSNDTALAKVKAGGHGFDIVVPSSSYVPIWVNEGLLLESRPDQMENFKHMDEQWVNVDWDPGRHYTVPWQWGSVGMMVDTSVYSGDINTSAIVFDPPQELIGKINVAPEMGDVMSTAIMYVGGEPCTSDKAVLKKVRDKLMEAKSNWKSMDYGVIERFAGRDLAASLYWNGAAFRTREKNADVRYGYPKEGYPLWMDSATILKDAKNVDNAKIFLNFIMEPENAALISAFARYANGIKGSEAYMPKDMLDAPEVVIPQEFLAAGRFTPTCPPEVQKMYTAIWTELQK
ncbi:MAG: extracellular solute-binding protein [Gammaproteobacteria bacterium]|nr:extracellular solute-binding protein [Gammaproteobacteria bacterium]MDH3468668.1 extracellular solute-binding protein [Gammaproteobacteria bacterium]